MGFSLNDFKRVHSLEIHFYPTPANGVARAPGGSTVVFCSGEFLDSYLKTLEEGYHSTENTIYKNRLLVTLGLLMMSGQ